MGRQHRKAELQAFTADRIAAALRRVDGNLSQAARAMGCSEYLICKRVKEDRALAAYVERLRHPETA